MVPVPRPAVRKGRGRTLRLAVPAAAAALLAACAAGPDYVQPTLDVPPAFKEAGPWKPAEPQPADSRRPWWQTYGDPTLDGLMHDAEAANQNIRQAEAQYREALATVAATRSGLFPTLGVSAGVERARAGTTSSAVVNNATVNTRGSRTANDVTLGLTATWEPDLWGSVRRAIEAGNANAQASGDQLAAAHLSIQSSLAQDYLQLRVTDQLRALYATTITAYRKALQLTQAQQAAGVTLLSDVAQAETQLKTAQAAAVDLDATRATLEHAIAILTGRAPARFALAPLPADQPFDLQPPAAPALLPSQLLEHRPDIAASERLAAAANANIGVARAAWFPTLDLTASGGFGAAALGNLFDTPARVWSLGAALAGTLFDGGLRQAHDDQAVAAYDVAVAEYKQTVLSGFQQVEDNLANLRLLADEAELQAQAVRAAELSLRLALNQYRGGTTTYLSVVTAQQAALTAQRDAVTLLGRRLTASVLLITATGGGWNATDAPLPAAPAATPTQEPTT